MKLTTFQGYLQKHLGVSPSDLYEALWDGKIRIEDVAFEQSGRIPTKEYLEKYPQVKGTSNLNNLINARRVECVRTPKGLMFTDKAPERPRMWQEKRNIFEVPNLTPLFVTVKEFAELVGVSQQGIHARIRSKSIEGVFKRSRTRDDPHAYLIPVESLRAALEEAEDLYKQRAKALSKIRGNKK